MSDSYFFFLIALYSLAISNSIRALFLRHSPSSTLAWILINLGFPFIGVPLFFLVGQNRIHGYVRKKIKRDQESHLEDRSAKAARYFNLDTDPEVSPYLEGFSQIFSRFDPVYAPSKNHIDLLIDGEQTFNAIFTAISEAKHYLFISYYILRSDRIGVELKDLLIKKAEEGIQIFLLLDDMGSFWISRNFIRELKRSGVFVSRFLPVFNVSRLLFINFRNHRKLVVVDGKRAFTGGLNVGDEYIGRKGSITYWRDTHISLTGPGVKKFETIFIRDWEFSTNGIIRTKPYKTIISMRHQAKTHKTQGIPITSQIIPTGPTDADFLGLYLFMQIIESAKKRLWISTPYLIPDIQIIRQLQLACLRGVDVRIIIPHKAANWFLNQISLYYARQILLKGGKIYQYNKGFMHQKVVIVDNEITMTGSSNFDHRTIYLNFETSVLVFDKNFTFNAAEMLANDFRDADISNSHILHPSPKAKFLRSILRLTAPLL